MTDVRDPVAPSPDETIRLLQEELAQTNREVMALTIELETRLEQLRLAQERYRRLAENAPDIIYRMEMRPARRCTFMNPRALALTGYRPEEFYADAGLLLSLTHADDRAAMDAALRGESPGGMLLLRWQHRDGRTVWMEQHQTVVRDAGGAVLAVECVVRDVTERKNLEEQLRQSQKMEAVGRLAGGVAHDFNNLLTVITGYGAQALAALDPGNELHEAIQEITTAADRAASLTRQLLAFSRRQVLQPQTFDLNRVVDEMDRMARRLLGEDVDLQTVAAPGEAWIFADRGQIEQVIMNLVINARDAMPHGGKLLLETSYAELDDTYAHQHGLAVAPGRYAMLAVTDTGNGMDEATRARIFEPFFTTKPQGQGTGLGLSMVYGIVKQSGGTVWVYSEVGKGTTFKIYLPAVGRLPETPAMDRRVANPATGAETILVVDDESGVRKLLCTALRRAGYTVLEAKDAESALVLVEEHKREIHLAISDVVLPGMGGAELSQRLRASRPAMKLLFTSGYTDQSITRMGLVDGEIPFLQKPFTPASLTAKVREVLDRK